MPNDETYKSSDGTVFETEEAMKAYETELKEIQRAVDKIAGYCQKRCDCDGCLFDWGTGCMFSQVEPSRW